MRELIIIFIILLFIGFLVDKVKGLIFVSILFLPFLLFFTEFSVGFDDAGIIPKETKELLLYWVDIGVLIEIALIFLFMAIKANEKK